MMANGEEQHVNSPSSRLERSSLLSLQDSIVNLNLTCLNATDASDPEHVQHLSDLLRLLRPALIGDDGRAKDTFRESDGFTVLINVLRSCAGLYHGLNSKADVGERFLDLLSALFEVASEALSENIVNRRDFGKSPDADGWLDFERALLGTGVFSDVAGQERAFGLLFALALQEEALTSMFRRLQRTMGDAASLESQNLASSNADVKPIKDAIEQIMSSGETLWCPKAISIILKCALTEMRHQSNHGGDPILGSVVLLALDHVCRASVHNLVAVHRNGVMRYLQDNLVTSVQGSADAESLRILFSTLIRLGMNDLQGYDVLSNSDMEGFDVLRKAYHSPNQPHSFHFDLSMHGYAAIEYPDLGAPFPPRQDGYSISAWVRIDCFDSACHPTIFGAFDITQTCFILLYLDKDSHHLILQTRPAAQAASALFTCTTFEEGVYYHVALIHSRRSQQASLYINGEFRQRLDCPYPQQAQSSHNDAPIQAFVGTTHDDSPRLGQNVTGLKWSLASFHLLTGMLDAESILVHEKLGPSYRGNFQDSAGSFFTYKRAAELNLVDEHFHANNKGDRSISEAICSKTLDNRMILALSSATFFGTEPGSARLMLRTRAAQDIMTRLLQYSPDGFVVNAATVNLRDALSSPQRLGHLTGGMTMYKPQSVADSEWQLDGAVPSAVVKVASATTSREMVRVLRTTFQLLNHSWRLSEAFERDNGFAVLSWILQIKVGDTTLPADNTMDLPIVLLERGEFDGDFLPSLLKFILLFLGVDMDKPKDSILINPLAYRALVLDCTIWRRSDSRCQQLFYAQFAVLLRESRYKRFNGRRLGRMRIIKKLIDHFRSDAIRTDAVLALHEALSSLLSHSASPETHRSVALYITSALRVMTGLRPSLRDTGGGASHLMEGREILQGTDVGVIVLQAYTAYLCEDSNATAIAKFVKTVTNKWLLHLLDSADSRVIYNAARIFARLLTTSGTTYVTKFEEKTHGFVVMRAKLSRWWSMPLVWMCCFSIFFAIEIGPINPESLQLDNFYKTVVKRQVKIHCPSAWCVIVGMLNTGIRELKDDDLDSTTLSLTLTFIHTILSKSEDFTAFAVSSSLVKDMLSLLFVHSEPDDMMAMPRRHSGLPRLDNDVDIKESTKEQDLPGRLRERRHTKLPSTALDQSKDKARKEQVHDVMKLDQPLALDNDFDDSRRYSSPRYSDKVIRILTTVHLSEVLRKKDFTGLGLFYKAPEVSSRHRAEVASTLLQSLILRMMEELDTHPDIFCEPWCLTNVARFCSQTSEAIFEGWLPDVAFSLMRFLATLLKYLQSSGIRELKIVRLCSPTIKALTESLRTLALVQLISLNNLDARSARNMVVWICQWSRTMLLQLEGDDILLEQFFYAIYHQVQLSDDQELQTALTKLWQLIVRYEPMISSHVLSQPAKYKELGIELFSMLSDGSGSTLSFVLLHRATLDDYFSRSCRGRLAMFIRGLNETTQTTARARIMKRNERLHQRHLDELANRHAVTEHESRREPWHENIYYSELAKRQRSRQDQQDNDTFVLGKYMRLHDLRTRLDNPILYLHHYHWALDSAEGHDRQSLKLRPVKRPSAGNYMPKRARARSAALKPPERKGIELEVQDSPNHQLSDNDNNDVQNEVRDKILAQRPGSASTGSGILEDFEIITDPRDPDEEYVDINRKVMRSLRRGEQVIEVHNVSRINGLEASFSLLIIGKNCLYLLDNLFQRLDGEVVDAYQAPKDERDHYMINILGEQMPSATARQGMASDDVRSWSWTDVINISKRRFLLRDVALELFFQDGRSYLVTTATPKEREKVYASLVDHTSDFKLKSSPKTDTWRSELFPTHEDATRSVGSRLFSIGGQNPVTARWLRGEISNYTYIMLINTMAGRTFTDLTQYPVFPWILRDYTSKELDLDNPRVYRDLSKPMGAQDPDREIAYRERYRAYAEMADPSTPPFHYGTHYSSAMIVTSYLIRLEPFIRSYILLQGGAFDYPERLFDSIEKTWLSASRDTVSDVRELTPEFFYLPEFLTNRNGYDFGTKENGEVVNDVKLPPWAKGDPKLFIAKQREALESPYVTANLHSWIDLVFGYKQQGEAAIEATNMFHHLSYHGAKDLDEIEDQQERLAAIGIIHNFGQTPRQVFRKPHEQRPTLKQVALHDAFSAMTRAQEPVMRAASQINEIEVASQRQRMICSGPFQAYRPPSHSMYVEWGNIDCSLRFYKASPGRLLDVFEGLHTDHISVAAFADQGTLVTAGLDCVVSVWSVTGSGPFDLQLKSGLFGHRQPINILVVSRTLSVILTSSMDGRTLLWDLNRLELVREIAVTGKVDCAQINHNNGHVLFCSGQVANLFTINGEVILEQNLCTDLDDNIVCCSFHATTGNQWVDGEYLLTGHKRGTARIWRLVNMPSGTWHLEIIKELNYADDSRPSSGRGFRLGSRGGREPDPIVASALPDVTCVYALDKRVYTGDEAGNVYEWVPR